MELPNDRLKRILLHILEAHHNLELIHGDKQGDLDCIKKEMLKINGFVRVCVNNIDQYSITISDFKGLKSKFVYYLENYSFEKEIETMTLLYSNDPARIRNMAFKIIEAHKDRKMIQSIKDVVEKL